jgi:G:T/U-mismatch repair DNA glycosylase
MDFYYPNITNDFWKIFGLLFFGEKEHFIIKGKKIFKEQEIKTLLSKKGIALYDTATAVRRLKDNASDKYLEVVTPTDIHALLAQIPCCHTIVTTGQKATDTLTALLGCNEPPIGSYSTATINGREIRLWRMPSTSRAYPLAVEKKADFYRTMLVAEGILKPFLT